MGTDNKNEQPTQNDSRGGIYSTDWKRLIKFKGKDALGFDVENYKINENCVEIGEKAFAHCENLKKVTIPKFIVVIMPCAFYGCHSLECIDGLESIQRIDEYAFHDCTNLSEIQLPLNSYVNIGEGAFDGCNKLPKEIREKINEWRKITKQKENK